MGNSYKFFENKDCKYYPCHKVDGELNCLFCYCPFYLWEKCPGVNKFIEKADGRRVKVCTDCVFPHNPDNYDRIVELLKNHNNQ